MRIRNFAVHTAVLLALLPTAGAEAQAVTERSPNLGGSWLAEPGTLHFNFVHRFTTSPAPQRKVLNSPTFVTAARTPLRTMLGLAYATNSDVVPGIPNEWELFVRFVPRLDPGGHTRLGVQAGWNAAALSADGELTAGHSLGRLRLLGTVRAFSNAFDAADARLAAGGGAAFQVTSWLALSGDAVTLLDRLPDERIAWSGGVQLGIPGTPHSMSIHATNTNTTTLEGLSRGTSTIRYGFEYTVPIHVARFRRRTNVQTLASPAAQATLGDAQMRPDTVRVSIKSLAYSRQHVEIRQGTVIVWLNEDPVEHTVTADDGRFESGPMPQGRSWAHTFDSPGTFAIHCAPHPFMRATVVVRPR